MKISLKVLLVLGFLIGFSTMGYSETVDAGNTYIETESVGEITANPPGGINKTRLAWALVFDALPLVAAYSSLFLYCPYFYPLNDNDSCREGSIFLSALLFPFFSLPGDFIAGASKSKKIATPIWRLLFVSFISFAMLMEGQFQINCVPGSDACEDSDNPENSFSIVFAIVGFHAIQLGDMYYHYNLLKHRKMSQLVSTWEQLYIDQRYSLNFSPFAWRDRVGVGLQVRF